MRASLPGSGGGTSLKSGLNGLHVVKLVMAAAYSSSLLSKWW
jgi:hypothetical protein